MKFAVILHHTYRLQGPQYRNGTKWNDAKRSDVPLLDQTAGFHQGRRKVGQIARKLERPSHTTNFDV